MFEGVGKILGALCPLLLCPSSRLVMLVLAFVAGLIDNDGQDEHKDNDNGNNNDGYDGWSTHEHGDADVIHNGCVT